MRFAFALAVSLILGAALAPPAAAVQPDEMLADPALEARAREIGQELRCLVCQNQSIDDSDAGLARDLRLIVRERLTKGDSDAQVKDYVVARYGDYVLLKPPFKTSTLPLWIGPAIFALIGIGAVIGFYRRRPAEAAAAPPPLTDAERSRLAEILRESRRENRS